LDNRGFLSKKLSEISLIITDVDGVLTDGSFYYSEEGKVFKKFGPHDGDGVKIIRGLGVEIIAISADQRGFGISNKRLSDMKVELTLVSEAERFGFVAEKCKSDKVMFIGDGIFDAAALSVAHVGIAPSNAVKLAKDAADICLNSCGGSGVLLEISELLLTTRNMTISDYVGGIK
jgi:3-deoxy-D-manno-octulosonate 8-phosphate phosphatase (KDO 8-P phosphatase)